ncbi:extracellular solute-binding protein [Phytoactinopolyspora alkaliphila]|uniref:Extracellular solute-binding protein n=1 Tax=Phytoactinopolyspora alkaliphila TaxID=1783498 RepID=A0A6N9YG75_9ACTN|nr:extracellular solute-binding protein [Phytoactinopolyspora alkaliphila]NED93915.1 extracellular solute-binding protein [Phytoactinopolyspora alkaliphila]
MRTTRNALWTTLIASLVLVAACGQDDGGGSTATEGNDAGQEAGEFEDVTLEVYSWRPEDAEGYRAIFDQFEELHPGITVEFSPFSSTDYDQILQSALQSGSGPDIVQMRSYARGRQIADQGYLEPVGDLDGLGTFDDEYLDAVRGSDGEVYGVPLALNAAVTLYNVDVFDEHGVDVPTTWPELLDAAEEFESAGVTPVAQAGDAAYLLSLTHAALAPGAYGPDFIDQIRAGETDFTAPEFEASIQRMVDLEPYFPPNFVGISDDEARGMFAMGEAAMYINGDYRIAPLRELNPDLEMGIIPALPDSSSGEVKVSTWVDGAYAALADSENVEAARALLEFMSSQEFGQAFTEQFARTSPVPGTQAEDELIQSLIDLSDQGAVPTLFHIDLAGGQPDTKEEFENALQGMYVGAIDADEVIETVQTSAATWYEPFQQ